VALLRGPPSAVRVLPVRVPTVGKRVAVGGHPVRGVDDSPHAGQPARTRLADGLDRVVGEGTDELEVLTEVCGQFEPLGRIVGDRVDGG